MGASVENLELAIQAIRNGKKKFEGTIESMLRKAATIIYNESQKQVPVDTGDLKKSGKVVVTGKGFGARAFVVYDAKYAVWVHENLEAYHEPPTKARYLADAAKKMRGTITNMMKGQLLQIGRRRGGSVE